MIRMSYSKIKYFNITMRGKKTLQKPPSYKLLSGESSKLKDKLQTLREQIKIKKQQKQMNRTSQLISSYSSKTSNSKQKMSSTAYHQKEDRQIYNLLTELKMENMQGKLKERNILKIQQLINTAQEEIDKWKDIPVGYRIKLKKYIEKNKQKSFSPLNGVLYQDQNTLATEIKEKDIEDIIKDRNNDKMFVPIHRQSEQYFNQQPQLQQQEQEKMMLSIMEVLNAKKRNSCFLKDKVNIKKKVNWSSQVDQMQKNHTKVKIYPKEIISKSIFNLPVEIVKQETSQSPSFSTQTYKKQEGSIRYCWSCLKKISGIAVESNERHYCSNSCERKYTEVVNPIELLKQIQQTETKYKQVMEEQQNSQGGEVDFNIC